MIEKIYPAIELVRGLIMKASEFVGGLANVNPENLFIIFVVLISLWGAKKILGFFYNDLTGRWAYFWILAGIFFWILKYLKVN